MDRVEVIRYFIEFNLYFVLVNLIVTKWYFHPTYVFGEKPIFINRRKYNLWNPSYFHFTFQSIFKENFFSKP